MMNGIFRECVHNACYILLVDGRKCGDIFYGEYNKIIEGLLCEKWQLGIADIRIIILFSQDNHKRRVERDLFHGTFGAYW